MCRKRDFGGQLVWIAGASSGIGKELACLLNQQNARVILSGRRTELLKKICDDCCNSENAHYVALDLTDKASIDNAISEVLAIGVPDLIILNSGIAQKGLVINNSDEIERSIMETNFFGTVSLTKRMLPYLFERKSGKIAVVSSIAGVVGVPGRSSYAASKHALHGYFESLRAEVHKYNLEIVMVMPGFINTQITVKELKSDGTPFGQVEKSHQMGMSADECAERIISGLARKKNNIIVGGMEVFGVYLKRFLPSMYDLFIRNHPMKRLNHFRKMFGSKR